MESLVGQHDTVLAIKKFPVFVTTKVENEEEEQQRSNYMETTESNLYNKSEGVDIKLEEIDHESINAIKKEYLGFEVERDFNAIDNLKQEGINIGKNQLDLKNEVDLEGEQAALSSIPIDVLSSNPEGGQTLVHKDTLDNITRTFETHPHVSKYTPNQGKRKSPKNKKSHKVSLKCEQCSYEAKCLSNLHVHIRVHKSPSELDMYECTHCDFKTKHKSSLRQHCVLHKDAAELPIYKCNSCNFESNRKKSLRRHIQKHQKTIQQPQKPEYNKNNFQKAVLKCEQCFYQCSLPSRLHRHMLVHKAPSELNMYECNQCNFKTKHKRCLRDHSILHKNAADIPRYKCNSCDFETSRKGGLIRHIRVRHNTFSHKNLEKQTIK